MGRRVQRWRPGYNRRYKHVLSTTHILEGFTALDNETRRRTTTGLQAHNSACRGVAW